MTRSLDNLRTQNNQATTNSNMEEGDTEMTDTAEEDDFTTPPQEDPLPALGGDEDMRDIEQEQLQSNATEGEEEDHTDSNEGENEDADNQDEDEDDDNDNDIADEREDTRQNDKSEERVTRDLRRASASVFIWSRTHYTG
ncbi:hypothetical protein ARSEF1564_004233 [Beauveria bassiana]